MASCTRVHASRDRTYRLYGPLRWKWLTTTIPANLLGGLSARLLDYSGLKRRYLCHRDHTDPVPGLQKPLVELASRVLECRLALVVGVIRRNERVGTMFKHLG